MQSSPLVDELFQGHIELERGDGWVKPWRLPHSRRALFPSPDEGLLARAETASGVRLQLATESRRIRLCLQPLPDAAPAAGRSGFHFDISLGGELLDSVAVPPGGEEAVFDGLPEGDKTVEIWLSQEIPVALVDLQADAPCRPVPDDRPRWVTYGSSLTHCVRAHSPARTWPAIVARDYGLHLTSLGYGGDCHLDPMVGRMIRDLPADYIGLKLGTNMMSGSASDRTFRALAIGLLETIRDGHPDTPIAVVSPICHPPRETTPNVVGMTIELMRQRLSEACRVLRDRGDTNLHYVDGLDLMGPDQVHLYADGIHPSAEGYRFLAKAYGRVVAPKLGLVEA